MYSRKLKIPQKISVFYTETVILPGTAVRTKIPTVSDEEIKRFYMLSNDKKNIVGLIPQENRDAKKTDVVGTVCFIPQNQNRTLDFQNNIITYAVGLYRFKISKDTKEQELPIRILDDTIEEETPEFLKSLSFVAQRLSEILKHGFASNNIPMAFDGSNLTVIDLCAQIVAVTNQERLDILNTLDPIKRLDKTIQLLKKFEEIEGKPENRKSKIPMLLNYGSHIGHPDNKELEALENKIREAKLPEEAHKVALDELGKLKRTSTNNPEHIVIHNYLKLLLSLPWSVSSTKKIDIGEARMILDKDHYAMKEVKKRVLEYLAVKQLKNDNLPGPILCFVGPPGVGKTSMGRSIANILGRKFQRVCLGGVSNSSAICGHRRAYMGATCGRIIDALKSAGTNNPVILLDEIDKLGSGPQGDPSSALLEVLDPEQNKNFVDHYLNVPFDLSKVVFIATANSLKPIQSALVDRMEIIQLSGYTTDEKSQIALKHILPKQVITHGLNQEYFNLPDKSIKFMIERYTHESGVREVERKIAAICRHVALSVAEAKIKPMTIPMQIDQEKIVEILGRVKFQEKNHKEYLVGIIPGIVFGLSVSGNGGSVYVIEARKFPGKGDLVLTGLLGKVLSESVTVALNWARANAFLYGIVENGVDIMYKTDVHVHLPEGAIQKDGPSGGIALATALISLFSQIPTNPEIALTGELSLQGQVLAVGGIKEKVLSAIRSGIKKIVMPKQSEYLLEDISEEKLMNVELYLVTKMEEVIDVAFDGKLTTVNKIMAKL